MGLDMFLFDKKTKSEVGYWRKANQIHKWFVDNIQQGNDDCDSYDVSKDELQKLLDICQHIKDTNGSDADKLLPTQPGFFFGSTEYGREYMHDIDNTIDILKECINKDGDYYYTSSW